MSNLICKIKGHNWQGCKCLRCGEKRDEEHIWSGCKCTVCGKERDKEHSWVGIDCQACVKSSFVNKDCVKYLPMYRYIGCARHGVNSYDVQNKCLQICERCGKVRQRKHQLENIDNRCGQVCSSCGYKEAAEHTWNGCTCTVCGETRDNAHLWFREGCTLRCRVCGNTKASHESELVSRDVTYGKCPQIGYSDNYACNFCKTPGACLNYPIEGTKVYRCKKCGFTETR